jgi:hypothetical protein
VNFSLPSNPNVRVKTLGKRKSCSDGVSFGPMNQETTAKSTAAKALWWLPAIVFLLWSPSIE